MTRIIVAATPIYGHVAPLRTIAADLVARGHDVTFVTASMFEDAARATGARFVALSGIADFGPQRMAEHVAARTRLPEGVAQTLFDARELTIDPVPDQHATVQRVLAAVGEGPVVTVVDTAFCGLMPVQLGAPGIRPTATITVGITATTVTSTDTAPPGSGLPPDASEEGRVRNAAANAAMRQALAPEQDHLDAVLASLGAGPAPFLPDAMATLPDRYLALAPAGVEHPRSDAPPGLRYIGPLPAADDPAAVLPRWWDDVLSARGRGRRVVVVTQGTMTNTDLSELVEPTLEALADRDDVLVVATTGREAHLDDVPANARVATFVPYARLLPHTDVLVTNGGYGAVLQALAHGVPLVLAGQSEDKAEITARVAWTGAAIDLATSRPAVADVRRAVEAVLTGPGHHQRAADLQREIAALDPLTAIADAITELLAAAAPSSGRS